MYDFVDFYIFLIFLLSFFVFLNFNSKTYLENEHLYHYLKAIEFLNNCDLKEDLNCYYSLSDRFHYVLKINNTVIFDNCKNSIIVFKIERVYFNKKVEYYGCEIN